MKQRLTQWIEQRWYGAGPLWLLLPLQPLYVIYGSIRRWAYRVGWAKSWQAPVPVLVVGNISIGGTGKTPLTIALIEEAQRKGLKAAVVSRGYGRESTGTILIRSGASAAEVGDEPLLIWQRTGTPVAVSSRRKEAAEAILAAHEIDLIIADDGLQHYALARDAEVVVIDSQRGFGNRWQLPCGPLREPHHRLLQANAAVLNQRGGSFQLPSLPFPSCSMTLSGALLTNLLTGETRPLADFSDSAAVAIAGIGNPQVFFDGLRKNGLAVEPAYFEDHHQFCAADLPAQGNLVIMTEKDAVKLQAIAKAKQHPDCWYLPVTAMLPPGFAGQLIDTALARFASR